MAPNYREGDSFDGLNFDEEIEENKEGDEINLDFNVMSKLVSEMPKKNEEEMKVEPKEKEKKVGE